MALPPTRLAARTIACQHSSSAPQTGTCGRKVVCVPTLLGSAADEPLLDVGQAPAAAVARRRHVRASPGPVAAAGPRPGADPDDLRLARSLPVGLQAPRCGAAGRA